MSVLVLDIVCPMSHNVSRRYSLTPLPYGVESYKTIGLP